MTVAGGGPAGLAIAAACARQGLQTRLVCPTPDAPWANSYGAWEDSVQKFDLQAAVQARFAAPLVITNQSRRRLDAAYLRFDTTRLKRLLTQRAESAGVSIVEGTMTSSDLDDAGLVIDATGARSSLWRNEKPSFTGFQSAYGLWLEDSSSEPRVGEMVLMDYRGRNNEDPPSFLYAMRETPNRLFVQETVLVHGRARPMSELRDALWLRLKSQGIDPSAIVAEEQCVIPMGSDILHVLPRANVLPFGAAAGLVHPATGYQLGRALDLAEPVARTIFEASIEGPEAAARAAYQFIWSQEHRAAWELYRVGAEILMDFDRLQMQRFTEAFFGLPIARWLGFMEGRLSTLSILDSMWRVFRRSPGGLRLRLVAGGSRRGCRALSHVWSVPRMRQSMRTGEAR